MGLVPATYVQATPDLMMGDLLKNMRSSQIFSVCGLPEIRIHTVQPPRGAPRARLGGAERGAGGPASDAVRGSGGTQSPGWFEVELVGLDTFDPVTMQTDHRPGADVPAWMLDGNYDGLCFRASQVFFPRTAAWDDLKKALKADYDESVWDHLSGTRSAPFEVGEQKQIAVKVIDDRGNELLVVKALGQGQWASSRFRSRSSVRRSRNRRNTGISKRAQYPQSLRQAVALPTTSTESPAAKPTKARRRAHLSS
jgi:adenine-specific DNA-methyltransferase